MVWKWEGSMEKENWIIESYYLGIYISLKHTVGGGYLQRKKWIVHFDPKAVDSVLILLISHKKEFGNLGEALTKRVSCSQESLLAENFVVSVECNGCQRRSWFVEREAWSFSMKGFEY